MTSFLPAFGKIPELIQLNAFIWSTVHGWNRLPAGSPFGLFADPATTESKAVEDPETLAARLRDENDQRAMREFVAEQADEDYPYLLSLAVVRLWALLEAAVREVCVEAVKNPSALPKPAGVEKLQGSLGAMVGVSVEEQADLLTTALWRSVDEGRSGVIRLEAILGRIGLEGSAPGTIVEITREVAEVRHCVVHRGGFVDRRLLKACPWFSIPMGKRVPATLPRYWFYRNAAYWYLLDLVRRWARWKSIPSLIKLADEMQAVAMGELASAWTDRKRVTSVG